MINEPPEPPDPDQKSRTWALVHQVQQGERELFAELFDRIAPSLYSWTKLRTPPKLRAAAEAEDVVQEVWCRALLRFADFDSQRARFRSWVFGIAKNVLMEVFKASRGRPARGAGESGTMSLDDIPAEATAVSQRVARDLEVQAFLERVAKLDAEDRELLILRGLEELPHEQVGVHLGIATDAAQKRWIRLRDRLRAEGLRGDMIEV